MGTRLLEVQDLKTYFIKGKSVMKAVDGVSFYVDENETLGLVGESGCGKTLSCLSILRLVPGPAGRIISGRILFEGKDLLTISEKEMRKIRGKKISMILQDPMTSLNPVLTIGDQTGEAITIHSRLKKADLISKIIEILRLVKISTPETLINVYPHQMSGGMKQRVVGAISISCRPRVLIADEPTTSLDTTVQAQYLELLKTIQRELGMAIIFITHDFGIVASVCNRVSVMYAGKIVESAPVKDIFYKPCHHYTAALLRAVPKLTTKSDRLVSLQGQPPRLDRISAGCRFAPRCPRADEKCRCDEPPPSIIDSNHYFACWHQLAG
jgi:oligopeptide/dipeptide ABC transporter ATP-binding protein